MIVHITAVSDVKVRLSNPAAFIALVLVDYYVYDAYAPPIKQRLLGNVVTHACHHEGQETAWKIESTHSLDSIWHHLKAMFTRSMQYIHNIQWPPKIFGLLIDVHGRAGSWKKYKCK